MFALSRLKHYQCDFLTELRSATLHETISNYGTYTAKHNLTPELHACCSNNTQCISNLLRQTRDHLPTTLQKLIFVSENILHAQKFRKKAQVRNTTTLDRNYRNAIGSSKPANEKTKYSILTKIQKWETFHLQRNYFILFYKTLAYGSN